MTTTYCQQGTPPYVTILAIYDEEDECADRNMRFAVGGTSSPSTSSPVAFSAIDNRNEGSNNAFSSSSEGDIVEITSLTEPPTNGLKVLADDSISLEQQPSLSCPIVKGSNFTHPHYEQRRSVVSNASRIHPTVVKTGESPKTRYKGSVSSELERRFVKNGTVASAAHLSPSCDGTVAMSRSSARKSRITDSFFEAKERLEETLALQSSHSRGPSSDEKNKPPIPAVNPLQTVIPLSDSLVNHPLGIEISPIYDPSSETRLQSVEIRQIDEEGRIAADGRIKLGDHIVEINHRPVYQMSISRARGYLRELQSVSHPTLTIDRHIDTFQNQEQLTKGETEGQSSGGLMKRPVLSALQQANTTVVGPTSYVEITKSNQGFGFNITGRETAKGERLFCIGTVKPGGPAFGILKTGDRLLEVNGEPTKGLNQCSVVDRLKELTVGEKVKLLISRIEKENENCSDGMPSMLNEGQAAEFQTSDCSEQNRFSKNVEQQEEILAFDIPLNGSAGLGISLKALSRRKNGSIHDCGIFIKRVLHGGAAFKDGQLRVNDQLIGIEDIDLRALKKNSEASDAVTKYLKTIGPSTPSVRLLVARTIHPKEKTCISMTPATATDKNTELSAAIGSKIHKLRVEGYEENTNIARTRAQDGEKSCITAIQRRRANSTDGSNSNRWSDKTSLTGEQHSSSDDDLSHVDVDAFNRENPTRRSMSEKRHMGSSNDPSHMAVFQRIKHSRQASAPALREAFARSSSGPSDVTHFLCSASSLQEKTLQSVDEMALSKALSNLLSSPTEVPNKKIFSNQMITPTTAPYSDCFEESKVLLLNRTPEIATSPKRRSISLENIGKRRTLEHEVFQEGNESSKKIVPSALKKAIKSKLPESSLKSSNAETNKQVDNPENDNCKQFGDEGNCSFYHISGSKDKQQHRKSVGSSFFSKISQKLGGSWSRDSSPDKNASFDAVDAKSFLRLKEEEERKRIQDQYDRLKQKQQMEGTFLPQPSSSYNFADQSQSYATFDSNRLYLLKDDDVQEESSNINEESLSEQDVLSELLVANSKFYDSILRRGNAKQSTTHRCHYMTAAGRLEKDVGQTAEQGLLFTPTTVTSDSNANPIFLNATASTSDNSAIKEVSVQTTVKRSTPGSLGAPPPTANCHNLPVLERDTLTCKPAMERLQGTTRTCSQRHQMPIFKRSIMKGSTRAPAKIPVRHIRNDSQTGSHLLPVAFPTSRTIFLSSLPIVPGKAQNNNRKVLESCTGKSPNPNLKIHPTENRFKTSSVSIKRRPLSPPLALSCLQKPPALPPRSVVHNRSLSVSHSCGITGSKRISENKDAVKFYRSANLTASPTALQKMLSSHIRNNVASTSIPPIRMIEIESETTRHNSVSQLANNILASSVGRKQKFLRVRQEPVFDGHYTDDFNVDVIPDYRNLLRPVRSREREAGQRHTIASVESENVDAALGVKRGTYF